MSQGWEVGLWEACAWAECAGCVGTHSGPALAGPGLRFAHRLWSSLAKPLLLLGCAAHPHAMFKLWQVEMEEPTL